MKKAIALLVLAVLVSGCVSMTVNESGKSISPVGKTYYTKINIWYKYPDKIKSTNNIDGTFLSLGTKVKIVEFDGGKVKFIDTNREQFYTIIFVRKHTPMTSQELFDRYFSENNIMDVNGEFNKFTSKEQEGIKKGRIFPGMSKKAVLMTLGYPPNHKTPNLQGNIWLYWGRRVVFLVYFRDDVVEKSDSEMRMSPFETRWQQHNESLTSDDATTGSSGI